MLLAGPVQPAVANRPPPPRPGLSWAEADVLAQALEEVAAAFKAGKPVTKQSLVVTEAQLNSYLNLTLGPNMPPDGQMRKSAPQSLKPFTISGIRRSAQIITPSLPNEVLSTEDSVPGLLRTDS